MKKILLEIAYLGTAYCGYQVQPSKPTVQAALNAATSSLFGFECDIVGCSRTDSGVHANQFFATVTKKGSCTLQTDVPIEKIPAALCFYLPDDISVRSATWVDEGFHPRYDVKSKEYLYRICNAQQRDPFEIGRAWHYPRYIDNAALSQMRLAADNLVGTHDFSAYMSANSSVTDTVRTIYSLNIEREAEDVCISVSGDGFLYNMVRIIVGTLIAVAEGKITPEEVTDITRSGERSRAGVTAPPQGLYLNKVTY